MNQTPQVKIKEGLPSHILKKGKEALLEMNRRRLIKSSLAAYARAQGFEPAAHHLMIIKYLEEIARDELDLLLIFAPPGSAKSTYVSVLFPAWYMANNPTHQYLAATHSADFAARWGRKVRNDLLDPANSLTLGISISGDSGAADNWALTQGGIYYAVGAGASISGIRADIAAIDDPFGSREDAYSPQVRQKRWDWYLDDFSARLKPTAKRIVMATRWHEDDISGRILQQIEKDQKDPTPGSLGLRMKVLSFPAVAEDNDILGRQPGQYLWDDPKGYNYVRYLKIRQQESSPMMWSALFQQRPAPESGDFFQEPWLKPIDDKHPLPPLQEMRIYGASDYAVTADGGNYTVHVVVGVDSLNHMYLLDLWRGQTGPDVWVEKFCDLVRFWKPLEWGEESGQIRLSVGPFLFKRQQERSAFVFRRSFSPRSDKSIRAQSIRARMATQGLYVDQTSPWYQDFRNELLSFPAGKNDDQVDAISLIGQMIDHIVPGDAPPPPPEPPKFIQDITLDELWEAQAPKRFGTRI